MGVFVVVEVGVGSVYIVVVGVNCRYICGSGGW